MLKSQEKYNQYCVLDNFGISSICVSLCVCVCTWLVSSFLWDWIGLDWIDYAEDNSNILSLASLLFYSLVTKLPANQAFLTIQNKELEPINFLNSEQGQSHPIPSILV